MNIFAEIARIIMVLASISHRPDHGDTGHIYNFPEMREMVEHHLPVIVHFNWTPVMNHLDVYGLLRVDSGEQVEITDFTSVACTSFYNDGASGNDVFLCSDFYGEWQPEGSDQYVSWEQGYRRNFMIASDDMLILFENGAWATR